MVLIVSRLPRKLKKDALEIYYDTFSAKEDVKLKPYTKEQALKIYNKAADFNRGLYALKGGKVVGIANLNFSGKKMIDLSFSHLFEEFGLFGAIYRKLMHFMSDFQQPRWDEIKIDGIAVSKDARGNGIGSKMLKKIIRFARRRSFKRVKLKVVNTNPRAKKLYERFGFGEVKTRNYGFITKKSGFTAVTEMAKKL